VALLIKESFLSNFDKPSPESWVEILPGRAAMLKLRGDKGALDIVGVYFQTGSSETGEEKAGSEVHKSLKRQRQELRASIARRLSPRSEALTVLAGDFNTVVDDQGRWSSDSNSYSGARDRCEEDDWHNTVEVPFGLFELEQDEFTFEGASGRSRLDRIYTNHYVADQLDRKFGAAALEWVPRLSSHRAIAFARSNKVKDDPENRPIPDHIVLDPKWALRVSVLFHSWVTLATKRGKPPNALEELVLIKHAMRQVAIAMLQEANQGAGKQELPDSVGAIMAFIRAAEKGLVGRMKHWVDRCAVISEVVDPWNPALRSNGDLIKLKEKAAEMARENAVKKLRQLLEEDGEEEDEDEREVARKRFQIGQSLKKLKPGSNSALAAVRDSDGEVHTDVKEMAKVLKKYWQDVFSDKKIDLRLLDAWIEEEAGDPEGMQEKLKALSQECWDLLPEDVHRAVRSAGKSAPGPDGLPYAAWKSLGILGESILWKAGVLLMSEQGEEALESAFGRGVSGSAEFNKALMVFLPKKPSGTWEGNSFFDPQDTRPLSIVNTDNRLIANAVRLRVEPLLERIVSEEQRGFLPGRSMLSNVLDVEEEMMRQALLREGAAAIFFDFKAAFPSVSHAFMLRALEGIGLPTGVVRLIRALYKNNSCVISLSGGRWDGFDISAGIRQGCPLSPLIFAVIADILLRRLKRRIPGSFRRAYADDLAMVCENVLVSIPNIERIFIEYERVAGLGLNFGKIVVIPLWKVPADEIRHIVTRLCPRWGAAVFRGWAEYLGFVLGPDAGERGWDKAKRKFIEAARLWRQAGTSLLYSISLYNIYLLPKMQFVAQLDPLPSDWEELEARVLRILIRGPYRWILPLDLKTIQRLFSFPAEVQYMRVVEKAAKVRVAWREGEAAGGLGVIDRADSLEKLLRESDEDVVIGRFRPWFESSRLVRLRNMVKDAKARGYTRGRVDRELSNDEPRPWPRKIARKVKKGTQAFCRTFFTPRTMHPYGRMRKRLEKWPLDGWLHSITCRSFRVLSKLRALVTPRVMAAIYRLWWDGWCTKRRFSCRNSWSRCCFGCCQDDTDDILHYTVCPLLQEWGCRRLNIPKVHGLRARRSKFMLLEEGLEKSPSMLCRCALRAAAAYAAHNLHRQSLAPAEQVLASMEQTLKNMVEGHEVSSRFVTLAFVR